MRCREVFVRFEAEKILGATLEGQSLILRPQESKTGAVQFRNPPPEGFEMSLEAAAGSPVSIVVRGENPGLPRFEGFTPPQPPSNIRPHRISTSLQRTYRFPAKQ
jgi:hypothetical protein